MEKLKNGSFQLHISIIESITGITGGNQVFNISALCDDGTKCMIRCEHVWDLRCSVENASIDRFYYLRKNQSPNLINNSFYIVDDSDYIQYFTKQISGTLPIDDLVHYIIMDNSDTVIDILAREEPNVIF